MSYDKSNIQVLVVDHDDESLASLTNILMTWQYKVETAKDAHHALATLRDSQILFDLIISEFHIFGMNGFEFQKKIQDEFQLPVIVMSKDNREDIISMTLEHGAAHFIGKPFCPEDFRDIWKYAVEGKKNKLFIDSLFAESEEEETKNKCSKRKNFGDHQDEGEFGVVKKPRLVWTNNLHNRFLNAIRQIGLGDVVPKKILEIMNVPNLTRENVASHLQKHRMFLKSVQEKGMEGGVSQRALNSKFASDLPISVINEIAERRKNRRYPNLSVFQAKNSFNDGASTSNSSNPSLFQAKNSLKDGASTSNSSNLSLFQANNSFNDGSSTSYPSYGGRKGTMAASFLSSSFLTRNVKFGDTSYRNQSIVGKDSFNHFNYGGKNWSVGSTSKSNILPNVTFSSIKIRSTEVGTGTTKKGRLDNVTPYSFGFNFTGRKENTNFRPCLNEKSGLVRGGFGLELVSEANGVNASETRGIHLHKSKAAVENEEHHKNAISINEMNENNDASGLLNSDLFNFYQDVQPLEKLHKDGDNIDPQAGISSSVLNESPISSNQNPNQASISATGQASTSATNQEFDMDLIGELLGTSMEDYCLD